MNKNTILVVPVCGLLILAFLMHLAFKTDVAAESLDVHNFMANLNYKLDREIEVMQDVKYHLLLTRSSAGLTPERQALTSRAGLTLEQIRAKSVVHETQMNQQVLSYDSQGQVFWQVNWEPTYTCTTHVRLGRRGDGGKWVCDPEVYLRRPGCVVYSFGSNGDFSFEEAVHAVAPNCEIHTVDSGPPGAVPAFVTYHQGIIGGRDSLQQRLFTPVSFMRMLGHRNVTILKMDCEGCEYGALTPAAFPADGAAIQQILFEVHYARNPIQTHALLRRVMAMGYAIFSKEPNLDAGDSCFVEFSVVYLPTQLIF